MNADPTQKTLFSPASIDTLIDDARQGRMFILTDDEHRENEGDLVLPAQHATAEAINFMVHNACGLVCLAMGPELIDRLELPMMTDHNEARFHTGFTVSIEARDGVTTGISAADRAHTIRTAVDPAKGPHDLVCPGHIFPIRAKKDGVFERCGQTEGSVDIMRLAGLTPAAVICEIMNADGTMARWNDLTIFARQHSVNIGTIADLIDYRQARKDNPFCALG